MEGVGLVSNAHAQVLVRTYVYIYVLKVEIMDYVWMLCDIALTI